MEVEKKLLIFSQLIAFKLVKGGKSIRLIMLRTIKIIAVFLPLLTYAQSYSKEGEARLFIEPPNHSKDSIKGFLLQDLVVITGNEEYLKKLRDARYFVARVYPYAKQASDLIQSYDEELEKLEKNKDKRKYIRKINKELKEEFGDEISDMSITRGKYLVKLIHRETGFTAYSIIKDYKNGLTAMSWQTISILGGANLKTKYDPEGEDWIIEQVMKEVENGTLKLIDRPAKTEVAKEAAKKRNRRNQQEKKKKNSHS
ncbi:MAG: DUF4294 domain-containing protein [Flavobacteriales bacterium]